MFEENEIVEAEIESLAFQGSGIAKPHGISVFVPRTAPGDLVRIKVTDPKKYYAHGVIETVVSNSTHRTSAPCPYFDRCGGCHYQHIEPLEVEKQKIQQIKDTFQRLGDMEIVPKPFIKQNPWHYRNRITFKRDPNGAQGFHAWDDFEIMDIESCLIADEQINQAWNDIKEPLSTINSTVLPFVVIRKVQNQIAIIFSVTKTFNKNELIKRFSKMTEYYFYTTTVVEGSKVSLGKDCTPLFSEPIYLEETIGDVHYIIRPDLFFQTNVEIAKLMVDEVVHIFAKSDAPILDIYCGSGLFTHALAKKQIPTLGIEVQFEAIQSAKQSGIRNMTEAFASFRAGKAERIIEKLYQEGTRYSRAIVDPPRTGLDKSLINTLPKIGIEELVYISCSPPTLARDTKALKELGFQLQSVTPYEMFPQTYHMECVAHFCKKN